MTFAEIVAAVVLDTKRPDFGFTADGGDETIPQAVKSTLMQLHTSEYYIKDRLQAEFVFDTVSNLQEVETAGLPRYRNIAWARRNDPSLSQFQQNTSILPPLTDKYGATNFNESMAIFYEADPPGVFDLYGNDVYNVYYQSAGSLYFRSKFPLQYMLVGWFAFPNLDVNSAGVFDSWIAREYPYAVIACTASKIFANTGKQEQARAYDNPQTGEAARWRNVIVTSNVTATAR